MPQPPRLKRSASFQHLNVDNSDPEHAHFHQHPKDPPYLAKRHRRPAQDEVVRVLDFCSSSSSYFSSEEEVEEEVTKSKRVFPSNTPGNPLYIRPGRRQVQEGQMHAPYARTDAMLTTISFMNAAVQVACLAEGNYFTSPPGNCRANNSFYFPLEGMKNDLWELYTAIESWSRRFKQMEWEELKLSVSS